MIIYKRLLGFLLSFLLSGALLFTYYLPRDIVYTSIFSVFLLLFYFWSIKNRFVSYHLLFRYFLIVLVFLVSVWLFFIIIDTKLIKYTLSFLLLIYLITIFDNFFKKVYLNKDISKSVIIYVDLVSFWLIVYFLFYSFILFRINILLSALMLLLAVFSLLAIRFYWQNINFKKNILYIIIIALILTEIYIITLFLALNFYSSTFILWIWYLLLSDFFIDQINDHFIWNRKRKLMIFVFILFIFYLISVK